MDHFRGEKTYIKESQPNSRRQLWSGIAADVERWCAARVDEGYERGEIKKEKMEKEKERWLASEQLFVDRVTAQVERMQRENPNQEQLVLFDIDDTLGGSDLKTNTMRIRPTAAPLLEWLQREHPRVHIGILSVREREEVLKQLNDPSELQELASFVDKGYVYSSWQNVPLDVSRLPSNAKAVATYLKKHPLTHRTKKSKDAYDEGWTADNYVKLETLRDIQKAHPQMAIMAVDNSTYPLYMHYGVCVYPDAAVPSF